MIRYPLLLTFALLTFAIGVFAWDACRTLEGHGLTPVRRVLRIGPAPVPRAAEAPPPLVDALDGAVSAGVVLGSEHLPGVVAVYFVTDPEGRVVEVWPLSGDPEFHQRAVAAARGNEYPRRKYRGRTISSAGMIVYKFVGGRRLILDSNVGPAIDCGS